MTDPIADMLTRVRNAYLAKREIVEIPHSRVKEVIARILEKEGYIKGVKIKEQSPQSKIILTLSYKGKIPLIDSIERVSKPGRRLYTREKNITSTLGGYGITILSTNQGIMTDKEARKKGIGGEVLCKVW